MKVLIGCEYSGTVRDAFIKRGHDAWSCDLLPCESGGSHFQMDIMEAIKQGGDLAIVHPPCTSLSLSGNRHYGIGKDKNYERLSALDWTEKLWNLTKANFRYAALENPMNVLGARIGYSYQIVHPWQFGHPEQKETWLWLHNLRELQPTNIVYAEMMKLPKKERERIFYMGGGKGLERARTFQGIADAMADQWGNPEQVPEGFLF